MAMIAWLRGSLPLLALLTLPTVQAGAPMVTEDAGVLDAGSCEWETTAERLRSGERRGRGAETGVACQLLRGSQLGLRLGQAKAAGESSVGLALAGKTRLLDGDGAALSLAWSVDAQKRPGTRLAADGSSLALVSSQELGALAVHLNMGWSHSRLANESAGFWALGVEWALNSKFQWLAEHYGAQRSKPSWALGGRWQAGPDRSIGLMASRSRELPAAKGLALSAKLSF